MALVEVRNLYKSFTRGTESIDVLMDLAEVAELFRGHEVLRDYAASLGARIVNRTRGSMIDAYERGAE